MRLSPFIGSSSAEFFSYPSPDTVMHGLSISPDLDTVTYTVSESIDPERGWGLANETFVTMENLARFTAVRPAQSLAGESWFGLGNRDLATHFYRTTRLAEGATLAEVTAEITQAFGIPSLLSMEVKFHFKNTL